MWFEFINFCANRLTKKLTMRNVLNGEEIIFNKISF
jgi:hypothetical protein